MRHGFPPLNKKKHGPAFQGPSLRRRKHDAWTLRRWDRRHGATDEQRIP